ncbi:MAG TPA: 30S ribosomal protein S2, partial [Candidatus Woesearchaeota archaeon]|nr:30S ribosomal protein S2 [Candidatus Woesearchaeota archaeon]
MTEEDDLLVPLEKYLQSGIHIGAKFKTGFMLPYIY